MEVYVERTGTKFKVTFDRKTFTIDTSHIDRDMCEIGGVIVDLGELESELKAEVSRKEAALDKLYADLDATLRVSAKATGEKATEGRIKSMIISTPQYSKALDDLHESTKNANLMRWAMVAIQKKAECLLSMNYRDSKLSKFER